MYKNIEAQIIKSGLDKKIIAEKLGININTLYCKLSGKTSFSLNEAKMLKEIIQSDQSIEELFEELFEIA